MLYPFAGDSSKLQNHCDSENLNQVTAANEYARPPICPDPALGDSHTASYQSQAQILSFDFFVVSKPPQRAFEMSSILLKRLPRVNVFAHTSRSFSTPSHLASPRRWRPSVTFSAVALSSIVAGTLGSIYPPTPLSILFPRAAPGPPADPDSPESLEYIANLEQKLQTLPILKALRNKEDADEWYETRPYEHYPVERKVNSLTASALRGPGKLAVLPLIRVRKDESESYVFVHLGRGLCGHDGIIHGGLLATLLDESLGRTVSTTATSLYFGGEYAQTLSYFFFRLSVTSQKK